MVSVTGEPRAGERGSRIRMAQDQTLPYTSVLEEDCRAGWSAGGNRVGGWSAWETRALWARVSGLLRVGRTDDAEFGHTRFQRRRFQAESFRRTALTANAPVGALQRCGDVLD